MDNAFPTAGGRNVVAVLGPTNTGKTHLAIERMLAHPTGMIGLPLRLLAREVYGRVAQRVGADQVALITGEEKIIPPSPRFRVCTVEAMPAATDVSFLAIDEIQLAGDLERGHVFTDRLLNLRGRDETLLLGAATMRGIVEKLLPGVNVVTRPRMSLLTYSGARKITRLPSRTAVVAFSADEVYAIAELIRRQRGGAAVVLGSLSPRTRNAQVELFQSGDVEFLVATDAIGMGLNLDVDHVAFASNSKFDGFQFRRLSAAELGQIAGRAGRHMRDGTFGVTGRADPMEDGLVEALEQHRFDGVKTVQWRNRDLDFASLASLKASLDRVPARDGLVRAPPATDQETLERVTRDAAVTALANGRERVSLLWDVCQVPDYRKIAPANHAELVTAIYGFLAEKGAIPDDWFEAQVSLADRTDGDIDALAHRIAHVRTWTFAANRADWLRDPFHWQERTRAIEDRLSDALHERLTARFVDRRTSVLMRRLKENAMLEAEISPTGDVLVEGQHVGSLDGFRFTPDPLADGPEAKALRTAAQKALAGEITRRAERTGAAQNGDFALASDGTLRWQGAAIARVTTGDDALKPRLILLADDALSGAQRDVVQARIDLWLENHLATILKPLFDLRNAESLTAPARGLAFRLTEALGVIERSEIADEVKALDQDARAGLRALGVRFGAYHVYIPALLKPAPASLNAMLWALKNGDLDVVGLAELTRLAASGRTSVPLDANAPRALYRVVGYRPAGTRAVRIDILERLADLIRPLIAWRPTAEQQVPPVGAINGYGFTVTVTMTSLLGCSGEDFASVLQSLGYRVERRPAPSMPAAETQSPVAPGTGQATPAVATEVPEAVEAAPSEEPTGSEEPSGSEDPTGDADTTMPPPAMQPEPAVAAEAVMDAPAIESAPADVTAETPAPVEPAFIEVWRPGRPTREQAPREARRPRRQGRQEAAAAPDVGATPPTDGARPEGQTRPERRPERTEHQGRPARPERQDRRPRPERGGGGRKNDDGGGRREHRKPNREPRAPERYTTEQPRRERAADPDSPFAALAALKAQLEGRKPD